MPAHVWTFSASSASFSLQAIIDLANSLGIRFYPVQAEGLTTATRRVRAAQNTLAALSLETGGRSFLNGVRAGAIADAVQEDLGSTVLLSFPAEGLPEDRKLRVQVTVGVPGLSARTRGEIIVRGPAARIEHQVLAAFASPRQGLSPLRAQYVPIEWRDGAYRGLLQVSVPAQGPADRAWELGASAIVNDVVKTEVARTVRATGDAPVVLEQELVLPPGAYRIVAVARNVATGEVLSAEAAGTLEKPDRRAVQFGATGVFQEAPVVLVREEAVQRGGARAFAPSDALLPGRATALLTMVCGDRRQTEGAVLERSLVGDDAAHFPPIRMSDDSACVQVRDVIPDGALGPGAYVYLLRLRKAGIDLASAERAFRVDAR